MSPTPKLFLDKNVFDLRWKVLDQDGFCYGDGETQEQAIKSARVITSADIYASSDFKGIISTEPDFPIRYAADLSETESIFDKDELIEALAELGGFKVSKILNEYDDVLGYTMQLIE